MLSTGVDVPEILNLVFFRKVGSKTLLQQMLGRGTRISPGLIDGKDKKFFTVFDYTHNFDNLDFDLPSSNTPLHQRIFDFKVLVVKLLQDGQFATDENVALREKLVKELLDDIKHIDRDHFAVRDQHLPFVDRYSNPKRFECLSEEDIFDLNVHIAPFVKTADKDVQAQRFDGLMYSLEALVLMNAGRKKQIHDLRAKAFNIRKDGAGIAKVRDKMTLINSIIESEDLENWSAARFEYVREELRGLVSYISKKEQFYYSKLSDEILSVEEVDLDLEVFGSVEYRNKVESLISKYSDNEVIQKIHHNEILSSDDVAVLQDILCKEVGGTPELFKEAFGNKTLVRAVRECVGLDSETVSKLFSDFIMTHELDDRIYQFLEAVMNNLVKNGILLVTQLNTFPFVRDGRTMENTFGKKMEYLREIREILDDINVRGGVQIVDGRYVE